MILTALKIASPPARNLEKVFTNLKDLVDAALGKTQSEEVTLTIDKKYGGGKLKFSNLKDLKTFCTSMGELGRKL